MNKCLEIKVLCCVSANPAVNERKVYTLKCGWIYGCQSDCFKSTLGNLALLQALWLKNSLFDCF